MAEHVHDMVGLETYVGPRDGCPYYPCGRKRSQPVPRSDLLVAFAQQVDDANARHGKPEALCLLCGSMKYDGVGGILHFDMCALLRYRQEEKA